MFRSILLIALSFTVACAPNVGSYDGEIVEDADARLVEGTPAAVGVLDFLNAETTTLAVLDDAVGLDSRAANSLIAYRDGDDGIYASGSLFATIESADDQYYVGVSALNRIEEYAGNNGWVPEGDDALGTWDTVDFTVDEAAAVVEMANTAGFNTLDLDFSMNRRAVQSIVDARPIQSVAHLAGLYYVGPSALNTLKDEATGVSGCPVEGWEIEYVFADQAGWRDTLNGNLVAIIDDVVTTDDWCGNAYGDTWFVKATVDRFNCEEKGYTIELGQLVEQNATSWYIEFEVKQDFSYNGPVCEI